MSDVQATFGFEPSGYCPRCDYRTDPCTCPECGLAIAPHKLRKAPRTWLHRHYRLVVGTLVVVVGLGWAARTRPEVVPYLPTFCLLDLQVSDSPLSKPVTQELSKRYVAGTLTQAQVTQFVKHWAHVEWSAVLHRDAGRKLSDAFFKVGRRTTARLVRCEQLESQSGGGRLPFLLLRNAFTSHAFPVATKLPFFSYEEAVHRLRIDATEVPIGTTLDEALWSSSGAEGYSASLLPDGVAEHLTARYRLLLRRQGFYCSSLLVTPGCDPGVHEFEVETTVVVTDLGTNKVIASWPLTHHVRVNVKAGFHYAPVHRAIICGRRRPPVRYPPAPRPSPSISS